METAEIQRRSSLLFPIQNIKELELDTKVHEDFIMEKAPHYGLLVNHLKDTMNAKLEVKMGC